MQIKDVAGIRFAAGWPFQHQRNLPIRHRVFRQIVINDERVHSVVHEPLAHRRAGKRRQILIRRRVRRRCRDDCRVRHSAFALENVECAGDVGILLTDRDINAIKRPIIFVAFVLRGFVQTRLADNGVERDRRFSRRTVAYDQFPLTAADRNHRVDGHDAGLDGLANTAALDHTRRNLFERIKCFSLDRPLVIERLSERIDHASKKRFANRDLEKFSRSFHFVAFGNFRRFSEQNRADFGLLQVQGQAEHPAWKFDHLVKHHVA